MNNNKLNLLDILNAKLRHTQQSVSSTGLTLPLVHHGHVNDGIHDLTYGYANTNRVFHELIASAKTAITNVDRTSTLGNLSDYITASQEVSTDKLVINTNGTISDSRLLRLADITPGILTGLSDLLAAYTVDENNVIIVSKTQILSYNIESHDLVPLVNIDQTNFNDGIVSTKLITSDTFQITTHAAITQYIIQTELIDDDTTVSVAVVWQIDLLDIYSSLMLNIVDVDRRNSVNDILNSYSDTIWFDNFIALVDSPISTLGVSSIATMQTIGILTGYYGAYQLVKTTAGSYFLRILDNETVVKSLTYIKDSTTWLVFFNNVGVKTYKIKTDGVQTFDTTVSTMAADAEETDLTWTWLPETGNIEMVINSNQFANINGILEYGVDLTLNDDSSYTQRIPGACVGDIQFARYIDRNGNPAIMLRDTFNDANTLRCKFNVSATGMTRLIHDYDLHEFNGFKEVSVQDVVQFNSEYSHFLFTVKNVGVIHGEITTTSAGTEGMRLRNIRKYDGTNSLNMLPTDNCVFIFNTTTEELYSCAVDADNLATITLTSGLIPSNISEPVNNYVFIIDSTNTKIYRALLKRYTESSVTDLSTTVADIISDTSTSVLAGLFKLHTDSMHSDDSAMTRLNQFIYDLKQASTSDSTVFVSDSTISYVSTGYGLTNIERVVTDEDSNYVYGRIKSKTLNAYVGMSSEARRTTDNLLFRDTVIDADGVETSLNTLAYTAYRIADNIVRLDIDIPTTFTYYVNNILGWSKGANSGATLTRKNLNDGYLSGKLENCITEYQLVLNREYFNINRIINANCQLASAPLGVYSDKTYFDALHYGLFDSPVITPLCTTELLDDDTYEITSNQNNEIILTYCIFGGDALTISVLLETA